MTTAKELEKQSTIHKRKIWRCTTIKVIAKERGLGKTYDLIKVAVQCDGVIVCSDKVYTHLIEDAARYMGVSIRTPICYRQLRGLDADTKVLFDNAEHTLQALLQEHYGVHPSQIAAITVTAEEDESEKIRRAAQPLVNYLRKNYDSRATILVENDFVTIRQDEMGVPVSM